jgi:hypothetical protein
MDELHGPSSSTERHPEWIPTAAAVAVVLGVMWLSIDAPADTGQRIHGMILACSASRNGAGADQPYRCIIQADDGRRLAFYAPGFEQPGVHVLLSVQMRRITRRTLYVPLDYQSP